MADKATKAQPRRKSKSERIHIRRLKQEARKSGVARK